MTTPVFSWPRWAAKSKGALRSLKEERQRERERRRGTKVWKRTDSTAAWAGFGLRAEGLQGRLDLLFYRC